MSHSYYSQQQHYANSNNNSNSNNNNGYHQPLLSQQQQQIQYLPGGDTVAGSKTTVFLPDGGGFALDGSVAQPSTSAAARIFVGSPQPPAAGAAGARHAAPSVQYTAGHHRDKLDLIRDSLKPFEQPNAAGGHGAGDLPPFYGCDGDATTSGGADGATDVDGSDASAGEPPEEIQRMMIHALTQVGYDRESAYYALKLVNFNSVMDAAKVLSNIKQNLQNSHEDQQQSYHLQQQQQIYLPQQQHNILHYHQQQQQQQVGHHLGGYGSPTLSANGRAALSRYGVMPTDPDGTSGPLVPSGPATIRTTAATAATTTISLENNGNTVFGSKLYINHPTVSQQQQLGYRKTNLNAANSAPISTSPLLPYKQQNPQQQAPQPQQQILLSKPLRPVDNNIQNSNHNSNNNGGQPLLPHDEDSNRSSVSPARSDPLRTPSPQQQQQQQQQQQKRKPRLALAKPYPYSHTQTPHTVLRHSSSFDPADRLASSTYRLAEQQQHRTHDKQQQQQQKDGPNRIERNASERIQPSAAEAQRGLARLNLYGEGTPGRQLAPTTEFSADTPNIRTIYVDAEPDSNAAKPGAAIANPPAYGNYIDQVHATPQPQPQAQPQRQRCISPLPESVARRLRARTYETCVRPCKPSMFRFFMEQHIEKLIQQYRERNQRAIQLTKEMELAKLAETMQDQMIRLLRQKESKYIRLKRQKMNKNMFDMIRHIGVGAFGKVTLVRKKDTGQIYAMKTLSKEDVIQKQQAAHVKAERDILAEANSNWIVKLFFSFQDARNLYFIMEYVPGGDMMQLLINKGVFSERLARFYVAELTCAIEYVHSLGFIHRDIKPDNILIDQKGHIKLTDFGLCTGLRWTHDKRHYVIYDEDVPSLAGGAAGAQHYREDSFTLPPHLANARGKVKLLEHRHHQRRNQAHSVVGTGNYMAPEVIKKTGHTQLCDWWSVGVILYEMVYGRPPFMSHNENPAETQYMIVNWRRFLDLENAMGARLSRHCVDIIARLCCDEEMRLGRAGAREIKAHPWFRAINFNELRCQPAEYVPTVAHAEDTSNFDTFELNAEELFMTLNGRTGHGPGGTAGPLGPAGNGPGGAQPYNPAFFDFTFRHFFASDGTHGAGENGGPPAAFGRSQPQQRPSLAPLIEAAQQQQREQQKLSDKSPKSAVRNGNNNDNKSENNNKTTINISGSSTTRH